MLYKGFNSVWCISKYRHHHFPLPRSSVVFSLKARQELLPCLQPRSRSCLAAWLRGYEAEGSINPLTSLHFLLILVLILILILVLILIPKESTCGTLAEKWKQLKLFSPNLLGPYDCDFSDSLVRIHQPF